MEVGVNAAAQRQFVLLVGGSGYVGLHLLQALSSQTSFKVAYTYASHPIDSELQQKLGLLGGFKVELQSGDGLVAISAALGAPSVVINCAAVSVPRECEGNPMKAMDVNVPSKLVQWLESLHCVDPPLLIQFSSDQVYSGAKSFYSEEDETKPVNIYGQSKVAAEQFVRKSWSNYVILRSSIIYGPHPLIPVTKLLPIQWIDAELSKGKPKEFFHDEYRCPIFVKDIVSVIEILLSKLLSGEKHMQLLFNLGGHNRLSRADMAKVVAQVRGYDESHVVGVPASSVDRGVASPADISMDISKLVSSLRLNMTSFEDGVRQSLAKK